MFRFRVAKREELSIIIDLASKIWEPTYGDILSRGQLDYMFEMMYSLHSLEDQMERRKDMFFIFSYGSEDVGYLSIEVTSQSSFIFQKIYVLPSMQGKGCGRFMIDTAIGYIRKTTNNQFRVKLFVNKENEAVCFYNKIGFEVVSERYLHVGNDYYMDDFIMEKVCL